MEKVRGDDGQNALITLESALKAFNFNADGPTRMDYKFWSAKQLISESKKNDVRFKRGKDGYELFNLKQKGLHLWEEIRKCSPQDIYNSTGEFRYPSEVDLHNLTVEDAILKIKERLLIEKYHKTTNELIVVTGSGGGSHGLPAIKRAVEELADENNWTVSQEKNENGVMVNSGRISIDISNGVGNFRI